MRWRRCALLLAVTAAAQAHAPSISLSKRNLNFTATPGGPNPASQSVILSNATHGRMPWNASVSTASGGGWLAVSPASGTLPGLNPSLEWAFLTVSVTSTRLAAGVYYGTVTVVAPGDATNPPASNNPQTIQVALTIQTGGGAAPVITLSPDSLTFDSSAGRRATLPLQVGNGGGGSLNWTATTETSSGGRWLIVSPTSGFATGALAVVADASGLNPGTYTGRVVVAAAGAANTPQSVGVTLRVTAAAAPALQLSASSLSFSAAAGGLSPPSQAVLVYNSGDGDLNWRLDFSTFNGGPWLSVTPASSSGPATVTVSTDIGGLAEGLYAGRITVTAAGAVNSPAEISVTLDVRAPQPGFNERGIVNAATFLNDPVSPGQIVSIFGSRLGPRDPVAFTVDPATGRLPTRLGGTQVTFDGIPAPLFFVSEGQVNVQVPFELAGKSSTRFEISAAGLDAAATALPVRDSVPGVFTVDGVQAAALNEDSTLNSPGNPAAPGSIVQLFITGQGVYDPPLETGLLAPASEPFPAPALPVKVTMDGLVAAVRFAGAAPGFAGLTQLNVEVPPDLIPSNEVKVWVVVGSNPVSKPATIAVR